MTHNESSSHTEKAKSAHPDAASQKTPSPPWVKTPQPIKRVFDRFPLHTYPSEELPKRAVRSRSNHLVYIFSSAEGGEDGRPSFNPNCLKWQAYLRFQGLNFITVSSNNHASPNGALPFLLPAASKSEAPAPVPSNRIQRWAQELTATGAENDGESGSDLLPDGDTSKSDSNEGNPDSKSMRYEAYISLLDFRIRNAYLYTLYLSPDNFASVASRLYIQPCTSNYLVRLALSYQLRSIARSELLKQSPTIDVNALYRESDKAFSALSELLGHDDYFFREAKPGLFDASVFAYTNILLDAELGWRDRRMIEGLLKRENLVLHRARILEEWF